MQSQHGKPDESKAKEEQPGSPEAEKEGPAKTAAEIAREKRVVEWTKLGMQAGTVLAIHHVASSDHGSEKEHASEEAKKASEDHQSSARGVASKAAEAGGKVALGVAAGAATGAFFAKLYNAGEIGAEYAKEKYKQYMGGGGRK